MAQEQPVPIHPCSATSLAQPNRRATTGFSGRRPADRPPRPGRGAPSPLPVQPIGPRTSPAPMRR
jgi:hypothetical protein